LSQFLPSTGFPREPIQAPGEDNHPEPEPHRLVEVFTKLDPIKQNQATRYRTMPAEYADYESSGVFISLTTPLMKSQTLL
jgi:hypothetical protein